jgi:hypothetical protein
MLALDLLGCFGFRVADASYRRPDRLCCPLVALELRRRRADQALAGLTTALTLQGPPSPAGFSLSCRTIPPPDRNCHDHRFEARSTRWLG